MNSQKKNQNSILYWEKNIFEVIKKSDFYFKPMFKSDSLEKLRNHIEEGFARYPIFKP